MRWDYPTPPRDFPGGFQVRNQYGYLSPYWATAPALHGVLITTTDMILPVLPLGFHTLMVKAFDRTWHESVDAPWLYAEVLTYPPPLGLQLDLDQKHLRWTWSGAWAPVTDAPVLADHLPVCRIPAPGLRRASDRGKRPGCSTTAS